MTGTNYKYFQRYINNFMQYTYMYWLMIINDLSISQNICNIRRQYESNRKFGSKERRIGTYEEVSWETQITTDTTYVKIYIIWIYQSINIHLKL